MALVPAGDLDDAAARRRERHIGNVGSNIVCRDGLEQPRRNSDLFPSVLESAMPRRNSMNRVERMMV
jgi:hypothetical protein